MQNPVLDGIMRGINLGLTMRREKLFQEAQQKQMARLDREDELRDIDFQARMQQAGARPVDEAGMVDEPVLADGKAQPGMIGAEAIAKGTPVGSVLRKAAGGQTIRRKMKDGRELRYELPSYEQQQERAYRDYAARQEADENARLARETAAFKAKKRLEAEDLEANGVSLSPEVAGLLGVDVKRKFLPAQIDELVRSAALMGNMRQRGDKPADEVMSFHDFTDDAGNVITEKRYKSGKTEQVKQGRIGKSKGDRGVGGGERGLTPGQAGVQERFDERTRQRAQADIDKLQKEEDELHTEKIQIGEQLKAGLKRDAKKGSADDQAKALHARLEGLDFKIKAKQAAKQRIVDQFSKDPKDPAGVRKGGKKNDPLGIR